MVEDDETIGSVLQTSLRSHGYDVIWHRRGRDAVREAAENPFDLVLLDLGLPDLDGTEVACDPEVCTNVLARTAAGTGFSATFEFTGEEAVPLRLLSAQD